MSHVTAIAVAISDLDALRAALAAFPGAELRLGQTTYTWYGRSVGDYPLPEGFTAEDLGKCEHAIHVEGVHYEIGLAKPRIAPRSPLDGKFVVQSVPTVGTGTYSLLFDFYGVDSSYSSYSQHDGHKLKALFGDGLKKLVQGYAVAKSESLLRRQGYTSIRKTVAQDGTIRLRAVAAR